MFPKSPPPNWQPIEKHNPKILPKNFFRSENEMTFRTTIFFYFKAVKAAEEMSNSFEWEKEGHA